MREVRVRGAVSSAVRLGCAMFGVALRGGSAWGRGGCGLNRWAMVASRAAASGGVVLVAGPSGSGKSTVLRLARSALERRGVAVVGVVEGLGRGSNLGARVGDPPGGGRSRRAGRVGRAGRERVIEWLSVLSACGLAEATLLPRRRRELSAGQGARLGLAGALWRATRGGRAGVRSAALIADELGSVLDRSTARGVCVAVARAVRRARVGLIAATAHDDVAAWLRPDVIVRIGMNGGVSVCRPEPAR